MVVPSGWPLDAGAVRASSSTSQDEQWWPIARQLGLRLQRARIAKGLSQEALAHAAGISTYTYQKFEKGESRPGTPMNPRLRTLIALATALDVRVEELVASPKTAAATRGTAYVAVTDTLHRSTCS